MRLLAGVLTIVLTVSAPAAAGQAAAPAEEQSTPLRGLVFLASPADVREAGWPASTTDIDVSRVPALADARATAALTPFIGQPFDVATLERIGAAVTSFFTGTGRPFVRVTVPPQEIVGGVVQIVVVEARLGTLAIDGRRWFSERAYRAAVDAHPGDVIDAASIDAAVRSLNTNPYRRVAVVAEPGTAFGTTDVTLKVQERLPLSISGIVGNTGSASTGETQVSVGGDWGNAFGRGDDLNARYTTTTERGVLHQYSAGYLTNLSWTDQVTVSGGYSRTRPRSAAAVSSVGMMANLSSRYVRHLAQRRSHVSAGIDWRQTNNDLLFGGLSVFSSSVSVVQLAGEYGTAFATPVGTSSVSVSGVFSPGGVGGRNSDAAFDVQREGATARYAVARASIDHVVPLFRGFSWQMRASGQVTQARLLSSEQMAFGGDGSIRGVETFAATRDNGAIVSTELRTPPVALLPRLGVASADRFAGFLFVDYGVGADRQATTERLTVASAGPGFRYQAGRYVSIQVAYGRVLRHDGFERPVSDGRLHFQVQSAF